MAQSNPSPLADLSAAVQGLGRATADTVRTLNQLTTAVQAPFKALDAAISSVQASVARFVQLSNPAVVERFNVAVKDLLASIGRTLVPVLNTATATFRAIGAAIYGLTPTGAKVIQVLAGMTVGLVAFGAAALAVSAVLTGGIAPLLAGVGGALAGLALTLAGSHLKPLLDDLSKTLNSVLEGMGQALKEFVPLLAPFGDLLKTFAATAGGALKSIAASLAPAVGAIIGAMTSAASDLGPIIAEVAEIIGELVAAFAPLVGALALLQVGILKSVFDVWAAGMRAAIPLLKVMADQTIALANAVNFFLKKIGFAPGGAGLPDGKPRNNMGAAVTGSQIGDIQSYINQSYQSALTAGVDSIEKQQLDELKGIRQDLKQRGENPVGRPAGIAAAAISPPVGIALALLNRNFG